MASAANASYKVDVPSSTAGLKRSQTTKPATVQAKTHLPKVSELLKKDESLWTIYSCTQNLPAALNDPSNREVDLFTKTWGETFVPMTAPTVSDMYPKLKRSDFAYYLKDSRTKKRRHKSMSSESADLQVNTATTIWQDGQDYDLTSVPKIFMQPSFNLNNSATFTEVLPGIFSGSASASSSEQRRRPSQSDSKTSSVRSAQLLHEKLVHYLDIVEVHLAYHVSRKSDVFFSTLTSQRELQEQISETREQVTSLRKTLGSVDELTTHGLLHAVKLHALKSRNYQIFHKLKLMATVAQTQPTIQLLLKSSDFIGALDLIKTTQEVLQQELSGIHCLRHLGSQLAELENAIERMMECDFVSFFMEGLKMKLNSQERVSGEDEQTTEEKMVAVVVGLLRQKKVNFMFAARGELTTFIKNFMKEMLSNFLPEKQVTSNGTLQSNAEQIKLLDFSQWLELLENLFGTMLRLLRAVQGIIKLIIDVCKAASSDSNITISELGSVLDDNQTDDSIIHQQQSSSSIISQSEGETSTASSSQMIEQFEKNVEEQDAQDRIDQLLLEDELSDTRIVAAHSGKDMQPTSITELTDQRDTRVIQPSLSPTGEPAAATTSIPIVSVAASQRLVDSCRDMLAGSCELIHSRSAKMLNIWAKAGKLTTLSSKDFMMLVELIEKFVSDCAAITGRKHPNLRAPLLSQGKKFLENFHEARKNNLSLLLDGERWKQVDIPPEIQSIVERFETDSLSAKSNYTVLESKPDQPAQQYLVVKGQRFAVVGTLLLLVRMITEYCSCADNLPMLTTDIVTKLTDLLKLFNSRTSQLVLGAGAVQAVGIKTITTRHLALSSRCLQVIMLLLTDLSKFFQTRLSSQQSVLLTQFSQITEDFSGHCREISNKLVFIIDELILKQLTRWEAKPPTPSPPFKVIIKQTTKLHEALVDLLPPEQLQAVFNGIEESVKKRLRVALNKAKITNNGSAQHGLVNAELTLFKSAINSLEGLQNFGDSVFDVWTVNR